MILVDYSQTVIAAAFAGGAMTHTPDADLLRHLILNTLQSYNMKYKAKFGRLVICADGANSWRKSEFEYYKANRAKGRKESGIDWSSIFDVLNTVLQEMQDVSLFPCIRVTHAEADDVIGVLTKKAFRESEKVLIISSDKDFVQLQKYAGVEQYSPAINMYKGGFVKNDTPAQFLIEHIIKGDSGDGIPNIFSRPDVFVDPNARQTPASKKKIAQMMDYVYGNGVSSVPDEWRQNFERNQKLIDLDHTPKDISEIILAQAADEFQKAPKKAEFLQYLVANRCALLAQNIHNFF